MGGFVFFLAQMKMISLQEKGEQAPATGGMGHQDDKTQQNKDTTS